MTEPKFFDMWQLLKSDSITILQSEMKTNLMCLLCKSVMIDACQTVCNCQFCYKCIGDYLQSGILFCPGGKKDCYEHHLILERDVLRNNRLNNRISKLLVECPRDKCHCMVELIDLTKHLTTCIEEYQQLNDSNIGVSNEEFCVENCTDNVNSEIKNDNSEIKESMHNIKQEFRCLIQKFEISTKQINYLIEEARINRKEHEELTKQLRSQENEIVTLHQQSKNKDKVIEDLKQEIIDLSIDRKRNSVVNFEANHKLDGESINNNCYERKLNDISKQINNITQSFNTMRDNVKIFNQNIQCKLNKIIHWNKLCPNIDVDFMWRIPEYSKKKGSLKGLYSDSFYSQGYRMCMRVYFDRDSIHMWCVLMSGDNDVNVQWPMKYPVMITVTNQDSMTTYKQWTIEYGNYHKDRRAFDRPQSDRNTLYIGTDTALRYSDIKDTATLIVNDSIVLTCSTVANT